MFAQNPDMDGAQSFDKVTGSSPSKFEPITSPQPPDDFAKAQFSGRGGEPVPSHHAPALLRDPIRESIKAWKSAQQQKVEQNSHREDSEFQRGAKFAEAFIESGGIEKLRDELASRIERYGPNNSIVLAFGTVKTEGKKTGFSDTSTVYVQTIYDITPFQRGVIDTLRKAIEKDSSLSITESAVKYRAVLEYAKLQHPDYWLCHQATVFKLQAAGQEGKTNYVDRSYLLCSSNPLARLFDRFKSFFR